MIRFRPPRIALTCIGAAALVDLLTRGHLRLTLPHPFAGILLWAAGLAVMLTGWRLFVDAHVAIRPTDDTVRLVTGGIYRWTRNPMYLGLVVMVAGIAVGRGTWPHYVAAAVLFVILDRVFCRFEEAKLTARFGEEYIAYARRVRRWA